MRLDTYVDGLFLCVQRTKAIAMGVPQEWVYNDLSRSRLLTEGQRACLGNLGQGKLRWRLFDVGKSHDL